MTVAALYIDPRGPYPAMDDVECWDAERDARLYAGPHPIVAHPPCGPWGQLAHMCTKQDKTLAPLAVEQLIEWGGVLEHPRNSKLFDVLGLPLPGGLPQVRGGRTLWTFDVDQVRFGHCCRKPTRLLFADVDPARIRELPRDREPTHRIDRGCPTKREASKAMRRRTPPLFAEWLVELVRDGFMPPDDCEPTHVVSNFHCSPAAKADLRARGLKVAGAAQKRRTPPLFAEWLVGLAGSLR